MRRLVLLLLCLGILQETAGHIKKEEHFGNAMQLVVHAMYDSDLGKQYGYLRDKKIRGENISAYFNYLFQKVEGAFLNLSVKIHITIKSVFQNNNLSVWLEASTRKLLLDRQKTMEKVKDYGKPQTDKNMEIYYYFVSHPLVGGTSELYSSDAATVVSTNGTFCTNESNAAVVRHSFINRNFYWRAAKATAYILGAKPIPFFVSLKPENLSEVRNTISRCLRIPPEENKEHGHKHGMKEHTEAENEAATVGSC
ncbi:uncharacterized protein LOC142563822 [Dermacentor variabilis]|uniref:uncharacterized protein LOC142563822 n=1 Tax=Dermacentor variabilis TaxID=34621 RepID=UPI003F5B41E6